MAVPKRKTSKSRKNRRRGPKTLDLQKPVKCSNCGALKNPHVECGECGEYHQV